MSWYEREAESRVAELQKEAEVRRLTMRERRPLRFWLVAVLRAWLIGVSR